jgi:amino acid adenylation domain-containing protein
LQREDEVAVQTDSDAVPLRDGWYPLSAAQYSYLFTYAMQPHLRGYANVYVTARIEPALDPQVLAAALQRIAARHAMLRVQFGEVDGKIMQRALAAVRVPLKVIEVDCLEEAVLAERVEADRIRSFDEFNEPLWRVHLYRKDASAAVLLVSTDHLICDGWSLYQLLAELASEVSSGARLPETSAAAEYLAYAAAQPAWLHSRQARRQFEYWSKALAEPYPPLEWPFDREGPEARGTLGVTLESDLTRGLREVAARHNTSLFVSLLAGYFILLNRMTGQTRLAVGAPTPARGSEFNETIGSFSNTVVLRTELGAEMTIAQLLGELRSVNWRALKYQSFPLAEIIERLNPQRTAGEQPYFQSLFAFQRVQVMPQTSGLYARSPDAKDIAWGDFRLSAFDRWRGIGGVGIHLRLDAYEVGDERLWVGLDYNSGRFERATIEGCLQYLQRVLQEMVNDPGRSIESLPRLVRPQRLAARSDATPADREKLLQLALAKGLRRKVQRALPQLVPVAREGALPLSYAQQGMWLLAQLEGASAAYHITGGLRLDGELDQATLLRALQQIVVRHEALRTTFTRFASQPVQRIGAAEQAFALTHLDLSVAADPEAALQEAMSAEASTPMDLQRGPLIRGQLLRLTAHSHVLLLTMHHIVSDGWSLSVLMDELRILYAAYSTNTVPALRELKIQYVDYAIWQREWLASGVAEQQAIYWKNALAGAPAVLELLTDRPRPARQDFAGDSVPVHLSARLSSALKELSQRHGVTVYVTLLAGWALLLGRLSGQHDVVVGSPSANRRLPEVEGLIALFVNTLALRVDLTGAPLVSELLSRVKAVSLGAQEHQDLPFEHVVELLQPARSLAYAPIFQATFSWQNMPQVRLELPGLEVTRLATPQLAAQYDLGLLLSGTEVIEGSLYYATSLFDRATVERYLQYWQHLLQSMVDDAAQSIERLQLLSAAQRHQILVEWNATAAEYPRELCIHQMFEAQARATPAGVALEFGEERIEYGELNRRANRLAHYLRGLDVGPDARVALCLERTTAMVVSVLAILKAGGGYVPLDPSYPPERLAFMIEDSSPVVVLTDRASLGSLQIVAAQLNIVMVDDEQPWSGQPDNDPLVGVEPHHLAYVIYTSGSTGLPKGVMVEHHGVVSLLFSLQRNLGIRAIDCMPALTSESFDMHVVDFFLPLMFGARVALGTRADATDAKRLDALLRRHEVTIMLGTPALYRLLLAGRWAGRPGLVALCGGEALSRPLAEEVLARIAPHGELWNLYGPTETTLCSTGMRIDRQRDPRHSMESIGRPLANTQIYILDAKGEPVGIGVKGEIYIGGEGVARGYLHRRALTEERFRPDPFSARTGARMYRTGDVGRWRGDGNIEFIGRNDHQVKIRGFNVELGEIEAQLRKHPRVTDAVVLARDEGGQDKRLVAYYVGDEHSVHALRNHLLAAVPQFMVPAIYVRMETWPLSPNGKIDRAALPVPQPEALPRQSYEPPQGEIEEALVAIWQELLHVERVGRNDHFFELGGHSLSAVALQTRIKRLGVVVPMAALFQNPTIKSLAAYIFCGPVHQGQADASMLGSAGDDEEGTILMREGSPQQRPVFFVHELTGEVQPLFPLANALDESLPVVGLVLTDSAHMESMERLAGQHVRAMRRVQPQGPYRVVGHSFGGLVAYEIANQLLAEQQAVEFVGLIDCYRPTEHLSPMLKQEQNITEVMLLVILINLLYPYIEPALLAELEQISDLDVAVEHAKQAQLLPPEMQAQQIRRWAHNWRASHAVMANYTTPVLDIDVYQFLAEDSIGGEGDGDARGWRSLIGERLHNIPVGGSHFTMIMQPTVKILAQQMTAALERAAGVPSDSTTASMPRTAEVPTQVRS